MPITDPNAILSRFVTEVRGIATVVAAVNGDPENIVQYSDGDGGDLYRSIYTMKPPRIMFWLAAVSPDRFPGRLATQIGGAFRVKDAPAVFTDMLNGYSQATGSQGLLNIPLMNATLLAGFSPMTLPTLSRRFIPVGDRNFDYFEFSTAFVENRSGQ